MVKRRSRSDARPSDAIAIGLRFDVPIFTYETILGEAGIEFTDESEEEIKEIKKKAPSKAVSNKDLKDITYGETSGIVNGCP